MKSEDGRTTTTTTTKSGRDDAEADVDVNDMADDGAGSRRIFNDEGVEDFAGIQDDDDEALTTTTELRRGDEDADDGVGGFELYVDDVILRMNDEATLQGIFAAARRFQNFIDRRAEMIKNLRTSTEADEK